MYTLSNMCECTPQTNDVTLSRHVYLVKITVRVLTYFTETKQLLAFWIYSIKVKQLHTF